MRWNWLDDGLLPLLLALMRTCWLWPLLGSLQGWTSPSAGAPVVPLPVMLALPLLSFALARRGIPAGDPRQPVRPNRARLGIAGAGFLCLALLLWWRYYQAIYPLWDGKWLAALGVELTHWGEELPPQILTLSGGAFLWLRGAADAQRVPGHDQIWGSFVVGAGILALFVVLNSLAGGIPPAMLPVTLAFFAAGMTGLAAANLKMASGWSFLSGERPDRLQANRYWLASIAVTIGALLLLGVLLGWLIAPEEVARLLAVVRAGFGLVGQLLYWIFVGVSYVLFAIIYVVFRVLEPLIRWISQQFEAEPEQEDTQLPEAQEPLQSLIPEPEAVPEPFRWITLAIVLGLLFLAFVFVLYRLRAERRKEEEEVRESVYSGELLQEQLASLWQRWRSRFGRRPGRPDPFLSLAGEEENRRLIRAVYQQLLARTATLGLARRRHHTPAEHGRRLSRRYPLSSPAVEVITRGYHAARYGDSPPPASLAEAVQRSWQELEADLEREGNPAKPPRPDDPQGK